MKKTEKIMDTSNMIIQEVRYKCKKKNTRQQELFFDLHEKLILKNAQLLLDAGFLLSPKDMFSFHLHSRQFDFYSNKIRVLYYFTNIF